MAFANRFHIVVSFIKLLLFLSLLDISAINKYYIYGSRVKVTRACVMKMKEKLFKRRKIFSGRAVGFSADEIILPNGQKAVREYLEHPGAVAVIPFIKKDKIIMVKQYRYPVKEVTYEIPAGKIDKGENILTCVKRELGEETGFIPKKIKKLLSYWPTSAFSDEIIHIFAAEQLAPSAHSPDEDEFIETKIVPFAQALRMVKTGKIKDSKTIIALLYWAAYGKR